MQKWSLPLVPLIRIPQIQRNVNSFSGFRVRQQRPQRWHGPRRPRPRPPLHVRRMRSGEGPQVRGPPGVHGGERQRESHNLIRLTAVSKDVII